MPMNLSFLFLITESEVSLGQLMEGKVFRMYREIWKKTLMDQETDRPYDGLVLFRKQMAQNCTLLLQVQACTVPLH